EARSSGGAGILYDSVRLRGGVSIVAHRPRNIRGVLQADHFEITVSATDRRIYVRKLAGVGFRVARFEFAYMAARRTLEGR
ncbi:hypothetical protein ACC688_37100, partial [Rhizobium ruizarguesonis]